MASSSKNILSLVLSGKKAPKVAAEKIDERILRLLGIEAFEVEMDYDTYKDALREFMAKGRASKTEIPSEEVERVRFPMFRGYEKIEKLKFPIFPGFWKMLQTSISNISRRGTNNSQSWSI